MDRTAEKTEEFGSKWSVKIPRKTSKKVLDKLRRVCYDKRVSARAPDGAVPCKLNNAKMTFITFGQNKVLIDKLSQRKFLSKFARQIIQNLILELRL